MRLLICVINEENKLEDILSGFIELGVTGATVIKSEGMGRVLTQDVPAFAGLQALLARARPQNTTVFSVIDSEETLNAAIRLVQDVCGDMGSPGAGIVFTVPVESVHGLALELDTKAELGKEG